MQVKDRVFILKKTRYGDSDLILNCMNPQGARINFFARSALKSKKRFGGGVLEPTHYIQVLFEDRSGSSPADQPLHTLKEASLINGFPGLRADYARIELALYVLKLMSSVVKAGEIDSTDLFNLLGNTLKAAESSTRLDLLRVHFEVKLVAGQGVLGIESGEELLVQTPIAAHESLIMPDEAWHHVRSRIRKALTEYLGMVVSI